MRPIPINISGDRVVLFTPIDGRHRYTGNCRHIVLGEQQGPVDGFAICESDGGDGFYLFGCDSNWSAVTDTWHQTIKEAMSQAEFEYEGISATWRRPD